MSWFFFVFFFIFFNILFCDFSIFCFVSLFFCTLLGVFLKYLCDYFGSYQLIFLTVALFFFNLFVASVFV